MRDCLDVSGFLTLAEGDTYIEIRPGRESPMRISMKAAWTKPELMSAIDEQLLIINSDRSWDVVVGIPYGGVPHAVTLSRRLSVPLAIWRHESKNGSQFAGQIPHGAESALVVEDVLASGATASLCLAELRNNIPDVRVTAIFTYGMDSLISTVHAVEVTTLFRVDCLLKMLDPSTRQLISEPYRNFRNRLVSEIDPASKGR
ncbi:phosphoribosyltransferase family protein [Lentzea sp. BCCO 10_0061]|uniref:Phosphoribosyltransferase family protein n=1 Tax=Lentzea sokolovensis TaxID=3095429 RepID=A0ABU4VDL4_9PSEU|nr:phosphoribosyltransferase family protein [Lentzea sp. BCCO 10_0061]MDX8149892.1 phosphoribosyltransferase family protein [Lentzea sp. BCCO 10_0061]